MSLLYFKQGPFKVQKAVILNGHCSYFNGWQIATSVVMLVKVLHWLAISIYIYVVHWLAISKEIYVVHWLAISIEIYVVHWLAICIEIYVTVQTIHYVLYLIAYLMLSVDTVCSNINKLSLWYNIVLSIIWFRGYEKQWAFKQNFNTNLQRNVHHFI